MLYLAICIVIFMIAFLIIALKAKKKPTVKSENENQMIITIRTSAEGLADALVEYTSKGWKVVNTTRGAQWSFATNTYDWVVVLEKLPNEQTAEEANAKIKSETDKTEEKKIQNNK